MGSKSTGHRRATRWTKPETGTVIALVGCAQKKQEGIFLGTGSPYPAKDLYRSPLFRAGRNFAETFCDRWFILSGLWGILAPDAPTEHYDHDLNKQSGADQESWAQVAAQQLITHLVDTGISGEVHLVLLCGAIYTKLTGYLARVQAMTGTRKRFRFRIDDPLQGRMIGQRVNWLNDQLSYDELHGIRLDEKQLAMLTHFALGLEQENYLYGAAGRRAISLVNLGLLVATHHHQENEGWTRYELTDKGDCLLCRRGCPSMRAIPASSLARIATAARSEVSA